MVNKLKAQLFQILVSLDQSVSTVIGFIIILFGGDIHYADETFSAFTYRKRNTNKYWYATYKLINNIFFWQDNHCEQSYMSERRRTQLPPEYRN